MGLRGSGEAVEWGHRHGVTLIIAVIVATSLFADLLYIAHLLLVTVVKSQGFCQTGTEPRVA